MFEPEPANPSPASALLARHADADRVAFGRDGERSKRDLLLDAAVVADHLSSAAPGDHVLLVFKDDRYAFAAALLGAWARELAVVLPPNTTRDAVWSASEASRCVAILHDTEAGTPIHVGRLLGTAPPGAAPVAPLGVGREITIFTSGTSGDIQPWRRRSEQLFGEVSVLVDTLGVPDRAAVVSTVPPGHIYGLLYSVLLPLAVGGSFNRDPLLHAEVVAEQVRAISASVLVTVPAHLRALSSVVRGGLAPVERVISSTAALPEQDAAEFQRRHGVAITEVLGSTETGGIAWRRREQSSTWQPLPGVSATFDATERLLVDSPFVDDSVERPFATGDIGRQTSDGGFEHLGRADGVVKIGGRRIAIAQMEQHLRRIDGVDDAAVIAVAAEGPRGQQVLAAVVTNERTDPELRDALAESFERSTLPRRIVRVDAIPREDNGKVQRRRLLRLFGLGSDGRPENWALLWREVEPDHGDRPGIRIYSVDVPENYAFFDGHFVGYPVLAGAVQLRDLVLRCARLDRPAIGALRTISRLKFTGRILPGDRLDLQITWHEARQSCDFVIHKEGKLCSAGTLAFSDIAG